MNHLTQMDAVGVSDVKVFAPVIIQFIARTHTHLRAPFADTRTHAAAEKIVTKSVPRAAI
jgi:hypothetical protein